MQELDHVVEELEKIAIVNLLQHRSIISLIGNVQRSSLILEKVLLVFCFVTYEMISSIVLMFWLTSCNFLFYRYPDTNVLLHIFIVSYNNPKKSKFLYHWLNACETWLLDYAHLLVSTNVYGTIQIFLLKWRKVYSM